MQKSRENIADGIYHLESQKGWMRVKDGRYFLLKGSVCCSIPGEGNIRVIDAMRNCAKIVDNVLQEDIPMRTPSAASSFLLYRESDGWDEWRTATGEPISIFRE